MSGISDSSDVVPVKRGGKAVAFSLVASQSTSSVSAGPSGSEAVNSDTAGEDDEKKTLLRVRGGSAASSGGAYSGDRRRSSTALLGVERVMRTRARLWSTALSAFVVSIPALLVGYTLGFASSALLDLTGDAADVPEAYLFNGLVSDLFAALAPVGAMFGGLISGPIADQWGRKTALVLGGVPYFIGYLTLSYAHYLPTALSFKALALTGRFITGVGMGWACMAGPVYIGEISAAKFRGVFGSFTQIGLAAGLLLNYAIGSIPNFPYFYNSLVAAGIAAVFEVLMVWLYETPRWLVSQGRVSEARTILQWLRGPGVQIEDEICSNESTEGTKTNILTTLKEFTKRSVAVPCVIVLFVMFFQQIGGLNAIASYAATLFEDAGVANPRATATYAVGGVELLTTLIVVFVIDIIGRKILLILSGIGMVIGTMLLGVHFYITRPSLCSGATNSTILADLTEALEDSTSNAPCNVQYAPLAIVSIMTFGVAFSIGWGPIPWILLAELTPLQVRGIATGVATIVNWGTSSVVVGFYMQYAAAVHVWFAWWSFMVLNIAAVVFTIFFLRETKGKTLEDIERYYQEHRF